jgi:hypothetical protein
MKLLTAALLSLAVLPAPRESSQGTAAGPVAGPFTPCPNPLPHEPLVVYELTGGALVGPVDSLLAVYSDGLARYSSSLGSGPGFSFTAYVGSDAQSLHAELIAAGALKECDVEDVWNDVPLSTLTVLRGASRQSGNTFSWWVSEGPVASMEAALTAFIATHFPAAPSGGGSGS